MENKKGIFLLTLCSMLLMMSLIITTSLTPLSQIGQAANQFNSIGMYAAILMIFGCYIVPVLLYFAGLRAAKYLMAVFAGIGIIIALSTGVMNVLAGFITHYSMGNFLIPIIISLLFLLTNIIWYLAAFYKNRSKLLINKT